MTTKIKFASGVILTKEFYNSIQNSVRFTGINRNNIGQDPDEDDELFWEINQRDGLYDWELNRESKLRNYLELGLLVNITNINDYLGNSFTPLEYEDFTYDPDGVLVFSETTADPNNYYIGIKGGVSITGNQRLTWSDSALALDKDTIDNEITTNGSAQIFIYVDNGVLSYRLGSYPPTGIVPLWVINKYDLNLSIPLIQLEDWRPHLGLSNSKNPFINFDETIYTTNLQLFSGKTYAGDTSNFGLNWLMPENPKNSDFIGIYDINSTFLENSLTLTTNGTTTFQNGETALVLSSKGGYYGFVYFEQSDQWILTNTNVESLTKEGSFISCGGLVEYDGPPSLCVDGERVFEFSDPTYDATFYIDPDTSVCYKNFPQGVALYFENTAVAGDYRCIYDTNVSIKNVDNRLVSIPRVSTNFDLELNTTHFLEHGAGSKVLNLPFNATNGDIVVIVRYNDPSAGMTTTLQVTNPAHSVSNLGASADITDKERIHLVYWKKRWLYRK